MYERSFGMKSLKGNTHVIFALLSYRITEIFPVLKLGGKHQLS